MEHELKNLEDRVDKLEEKLDSYNEKMQKILEAITRIEGTLESRKVENTLNSQLHVGKMQDVEKRVQKLEDSQSWIVKAIIGEIIAIIFVIVKAFIQRGI